MQPPTAISQTSQSFAIELEQYFTQMYDDLRKVVVGESDSSNFATIYGKYQHLFTASIQSQLQEALDTAHDQDEAEQLRRLWFECTEGIATESLVQVMEDLQNDMLSWRADYNGESLSISDIEARLSASQIFAEREELYAISCQAQQAFVEREIELAATTQELRSEAFGVDGEVALATKRMGISLTKFAAQVQALVEDTTAHYEQEFTRLSHELLGPDVSQPSRAHAPYMRSLPKWNHLFTAERFQTVCTQTLIDIGFDLSAIPSIMPDLEDRPGKEPRACVIPVKVPDEVHLIVRPTGGLADYQAFLHEAGHALHFGLTDSALPFAYRMLSPDNALTEVYSYVVERITHEPAWHVRHFGVSEEEAEAICRDIRTFDATLFRRYVAKLQYELAFWENPRNPDLPTLYASQLSTATGMRYDKEYFAGDIDPGLYVADYLRAWRTSLQVIGYLRNEFGDQWFCNPGSARMLTDLFATGTSRTNEDICAIIGSTPDNFDELRTHLSR